MLCIPNRRANTILMIAGLLVTPFVVG